MSTPYMADPYSKHRSCASRVPYVGYLWVLDPSPRARADRYMTQMRVYALNHLSYLLSILLNIA